MKDKIKKFLKGRYGADKLSKFLINLSIVFIILGLFVEDKFIFNLLSLIIIIYVNFRVFSKNIYVRSKENQFYLKQVEKIKIKFIKLKSKIFPKKEYRYFTCKSCKTKLRIPKKKESLRVQCPNCKKQTIM